MNQIAEWRQSLLPKAQTILHFQIKDKAKECNIAIVENKPLARILYHNVDIGMEIPPELYQAVAEILANILRPVYNNNSAM